MITVFAVWAGVVLAVASFAALLTLLDRWRRARNAPYRDETRKRIDESLGYWGHESMIARDRRRGRGRFARARGVREPNG